MPAAIFDWWLAGSPVRQRECGDASCRDECRPRNTAKETKTEAVVAGKPTTHGAMSRKAAAPEITQGMIAQRAYHISQSGDGGTAATAGGASATSPAAAPPRPGATSSSP